LLRVFHGIRFNLKTSCRDDNSFSAFGGLSAKSRNELLPFFISLRERPSSGWVRATPSVKLFKADYPPKAETSYFLFLFRSAKGHPPDGFGLRPQLNCFRRIIRQKQKTSYFLFLFRSAKGHPPDGFGLRPQLNCFRRIIRQKQKRVTSFFYFAPRKAILRMGSGYALS